MLRSFVAGFVFIFLLPLSGLTQQWVRQESGTTANLRGVWFVDSLSGWACGDSGIILHSTNAGVDWARQNSTVSVTLADVFFMDSLNGWVCGDSGAILNTSDGGLSWNRKPTTVHSLLRQIQFRSPRNGTATGERNTILESNDSGRTWTAATGSDSGTGSVVFCWVDQKRGSGVFNSNRVIFWTYDEGSTFQVFGLSPRHISDIAGIRVMHTADYFEVYYINVGDHGFVFWWRYCEDSLGPCCCIPAGQVAQTTDTLALNALTLERTNGLPLRFWGVGERGWIISSIDTGKTWLTLSSGVTTTLNEVTFPSSDKGWVVGDSGVILHHNRTVSVGQRHGTPNRFGISRAYPNPFNSTTTIELTVPTRGELVIRAYSIIGEEVQKVLKEIIEPGVHKVVFDASHLSSGVYFLRASFGSYTETTKLILMR